MLVDADRMAREAGGGLEPSAWFLDPMHFTVDGHDAIARMVGNAVAETVGRALPTSRCRQSPSGTSPAVAGKGAGNGVDSGRSHLDFGQVVAEVVRVSLASGPASVPQYTGQVLRQR